MHHFINNFLSVKLIIPLLLVSFYELPAQENIKSEKAGLAIYTGIGSLFSGAGVMVEYQISCTKKIKLDPFISIGSQAISTEVPGSWLGYTSGINMEFGAIKLDKGGVLHWLAGLNYGSHGVGFDNTFTKDSGFSRIHQHLLTGCSGIAGYKYTNRYGLSWQFNMGVCYVKNPVGDDTHYFFKPTGGFGIGYKF
jgi:hypothetical protein